MADAAGPAPLAARGGTASSSGVPTPSAAPLRRLPAPRTALRRRSSAEQSNSSVLLGDQAIMKFIRRFEEGVNPGVEIGRFLSERARFAHAPRAGGSIEYRSDAPGRCRPPSAILEEFVPNEGDGWTYVVDALTHGLEEALAHRHGHRARRGAAPDICSLDPDELEPGHPLVGPHLEWASLLGRRTAELHPP